MKTQTITLVLALAVAFVAAPGAALHGGCNGNIYQIDAGSETLYIDDRADDPNAPIGSGFVFGPGGTWIYLESNGQEGYQSGGTTGIPGGDDDCGHVDPDQVLF